MNYFATESDFSQPPVMNAPEQALILVVEDNPISQCLLAEILEDAGYRVVVGGFGADALELARMGPDLILLDVMMPGMNGYEVLEQLKADETTREIPVIFITGVNTAESRERGLTLGAVDYVTKPVSPEAVLSTVAAQLALRADTDCQANQAG